MSIPLTRKSLLQKAAAGSEDAWSEITALYHPLIRYWLIRNGMALQDAEELSQDVMCVIVQKISDFDHSGRPGAFRTWIREISVNHIKGFWRKQRRRQVPVGGSVYLQRLDELCDPHSDLTEAWNAEHDDYILRCLLENVLVNVQASTAEIFRAVVIDDRAADEVARERGISIGAVYTAKSRVIRRLKAAAAGLVDDIRYA